MKLLLDTHSFLWFIAEPAKLSANAAAAINYPDNQIFVSMVSAWEIAIKVKTGRLALSRSMDELFPAELEIRNFELLSIQFLHVIAVSKLALHHRDPFDRLLIAQAMSEQMTIVGCDVLFDRYGVARLW